MKEKFKGIWPAMFTPLQKDGEPAYDVIEKLVEAFITQQTDGLYILGSTGQGVLFTEDERKKVTEVVTRVASGRIPVIAHVGALTTAEAVRLAIHAEKCGVDGVASLPPIQYVANADMALAHYTKIASATSLPFFPYQLGDNSIPGDLSSFMDRLLQIPNIAGMKLTTNQLLNISSVHNIAGNRLKLFSGSDELLCHASLCGPVGAIGTFYNIWGDTCKYVMSEFTNGNYQLGKEFMLAFQKVIQFANPNGWTFIRKAMIYKYGIDIGMPRAPLGATHKAWDDAQVKELVDRIDAFKK